MNDEDTVLLARSLALNRSIRLLLVGSNDIGSKGLYVISQALKRNKTLLLLDVSRNSVGRRLEGLRELGKAMRLNEALTKLTLDGNRINSKGLKLLCAGIARNRTLTFLSKLQQV